MSHHQWLGQIFAWHRCNTDDSRLPWRWTMSIFKAWWGRKQCSSCWRFLKGRTSPSWHRANLMVKDSCYNPSQAWLHTFPLTSMAEWRSKCIFTSSAVCHMACAKCMSYTCRGKFTTNLKPFLGVHLSNSVHFYNAVVSTKSQHC